MHPDGRLQALCRSREDVIVETWSTDNGQTWSPLEATSLPNPSAGIDGTTLSDGRFALAYNPTTTGRTPLVVALSHDGIVWDEITVLEDTPGQFSYPTLIQTDDGRLHVTYSWKIEAIRHAVIELENVFVVDTNVDSVDAAPGDGVAEDSLGRTSLRAAIMEANALDGRATIELSPGTYLLSLTGAESESTNDLDVTSEISLVATGGGLTTVDADGIDRVLHVSTAGSLRVEGVGITGGTTSGSGGGIFNEGGDVRLVNATVFSNTAANGGGLTNTGVLSIDTSTISGNSGGGIENASGGALTLSRSTVTGNTDAAAAGVDNAGTAVLNNAIIAGNTGTVENTDLAGNFTSNRFNLIGKAGAGVTGLVSDDIVGTTGVPIDPKLAPLADNGGTTLTHALQPGSLAIDGGTNNIADLSGNSNTASVVGDVMAGEGVLGLGADFPGGVGNTADDYLTVDLDQISPSEIPTTAMTVAAWVKVEDTGNTHEIFASQTGSGQFITHVELRSDNTVRFTLRDDSGNNIINFVGSSFLFDTWFHFAATYDQAADEVVVYINGNPVFSGASTLNAAIGSDWDLGARIGSTTDNARPFTGQMDEFYLYTRALSQTEIDTLVAVPAAPTGTPQVTGDLSLYYPFDDTIISTTDQTGGPRSLDGDGQTGPQIDIGSVEFEYTPPVMLQFDFGTSVSPVETGYTQVVHTDLYNVSDGFGFSGPDLRSIDRGSGSDDVRRDFFFTRNFADFLVDLPNGFYDVTVLMGDDDFLQDNMELSLEGAVVDIVSTTAGQFFEKTYQVNLTDGQLTLGLRQLGGTYINAIINSLVIESATPPTATVTSMTVNGGNPNHSGIRELTVTFDQAVTVGAATDLVVFNHTTGSPVDLSNATLMNNGTTAVTWVLNDGPGGNADVVFADGRHTAELSAAAFGLSDECGV